MKCLLLLAAVVAASTAENDLDFDTPKYPGVFSIDDYLYKDPLEVGNGIPIGKRQMIFPKFSNDIDMSVLQDIIEKFPKNPEDLDQASLQDLKDEAESLLGDNIEKREEDLFPVSKRQMIFPDVSNVDKDSLENIFGDIFGGLNKVSKRQMIFPDVSNVDKDSLEDIFGGLTVSKRKMLFKPPEMTTEDYLKSMEGLKDEFTDNPSDEDSTSSNQESIDDIMDYLADVGLIKKPVTKREDMIGGLTKSVSKRKMLFKPPEMTTEDYLESMEGLKDEFTDNPSDEDSTPQNQETIDDVMDYLADVGLIEKPVTKRNTMWMLDLLSTKKRQAVGVGISQADLEDLYKILGGPVSKRQVYNPTFYDENGQPDYSAMDDLSKILGGPVSKRQVYNPTFFDENGQPDYSAMDDLSKILGGPVSKRQLPSISASDIAKYLNSEYGLEENDWMNILSDLLSAETSDDIVNVFGEVLAEVEEKIPDDEE